MGKFSSSYSNTSCDFFCHGILLSFILLSHISFQFAYCGSIVKFLPGFKGPLPFILETGYVGVGEGEEVQAFYYFIESENNPKDDPLMLWLSGGPGCSSFSGLAFEIGPLGFVHEEYTGSVPNLFLRPNSWTKVSSIIFADLPVSTGFTYATTESAIEGSDWTTVHQAYEFLRKWLIDHPKFLTNEVYIGGDSYSGIPLPGIVQEISQGNEKGFRPWINLQGYLLGNPLTTGTEKNYEISYSHGMAFISDELYMSLQKNCKGEYVNVDTTNELCARDLQSYDELVAGLNRYYTLDPVCEEFDTETSYRRSVTEKYSSKNFLNTHLKLPPVSCWSYPYFLCTYWANDDNVRSALHIRKGTIDKWHRCSDTAYKFEIPSSFDHHVNLSRKGIRSLIYSGDHDRGISFLATQAWIRALNYSIVDDWRQWHTNDGQVAGYTRTYSNHMTFATVKGGGHTAPEYKPEECFAMFSRWISNRPL